jgi:hypothetical protein
MKNIYAEEVYEWEILDEEKHKPFGERLTKFNCYGCKLPLSEADLCASRAAFAPFMHYDCCFPKL